MWFRLLCSAASKGTVDSGHLTIAATACAAGCNHRGRVRWWCDEVVGSWTAAAGRCHIGVCGLSDACVLRLVAAHPMTGEISLAARWPRH